MLADLGAPTPLPEGWHTLARTSCRRTVRLLAIIAPVKPSGTIAAVSAVVERNGWSAEAALIVVAGTALTLGSWYYHRAVCVRPRRRCQLGKFWSYFHVLVFTSIVAMGGVASCRLRHRGGAAIGPVSPWSRRWFRSSWAWWPSVGSALSAVVFDRLCRYCR